MFANIGPWQLLIILLIVLAIFGTKKLSTLGSDLGKSVKGFRSAMTEAEETAEQTSPPTPTPPRHDRRGDEPLLKAADVGKMLGIPSKDVYQLPINRVRVGKRTVRWRPALVREFIKQRDESPLLDTASRSETEETRELDGEPPAH